MKSRARKLLCTLFTFAVMILAGLPANAMIYNFSQGGYSGGGVITGSFDAVDINADGQITSFDGEVTKFSLSFSGDSQVGSFTHTVSDLNGLVYDIGSGFIGDGFGNNFDGLASNFFGFAGFDYASGLGILDEYGGRVIDIATGATSSTANLISVSAVPVPAAIILFGTGIAGLAGIRMRRRKELSTTC